MSGPLDYLSRWPLRLWLAGMGILLYAPMAALVAFSFNDSRRAIVWRGFTWRWYGIALSDDSLLAAFGNSLTIAAAATVISLGLGAGAALALWRFRFGFKNVFDGLLALPIVVPEIAMGVAMLVFFAKILPWPQGLAWPFNLGNIVIAHVSFCFPFVAVVARARLASFNPELEEAARDLGAGEARILTDILIPHMAPALAAGALLAFTMSLDDFVITFFTAGPDTVTFPVKVYSMVRFSVTPEVNAASTLLLLLTVILTLLLVKLQGRDIAKDAGRG